MADTPAQAFLSYAHVDDDYLTGGITWLHGELQRALHICTGKPFNIFLDKAGIDWGQHFPSRIEEALDEARFLIPIISQCYFASSYCREEAAFFLDFEKKTGRQDLILPIYLIDADVIEDPTQRQNDELAKELSKRQYADWRDDKFHLRDLPHIKERVEKLAKRIKLASERVAKDAAPIIPEQMIGIHFWTNLDGLIDQAKDGPSAPGADHNQLQAQSVDVLEACVRAINSFADSSSQDTVGTLLSDLERYRTLIDAPVREIDMGELWCRGVAVAQLAENADRDLERLELPPLEDKQQAFLNTFIRLHTAFVLATPKGKIMQANADRYPTSRDKKANVFELMGRLGDAVRDIDDLVTEQVKALLATFCRRLDHQALPEEHLLAVLSTCRNLLLAVAEAATGKDVDDIGDEAIGKVQVSATCFLLDNEGLARELAASGYDGLAWLDQLLTWLKPTPAPTIATTTLWTPGRVFREIDEPWCPEMVVIPAGEFLMGSKEDEEGRGNDEGPQHRVTFKKPFALGRYPVTFEEFDFFCDETDREKPGDWDWGRGRRPVILVSWDDATAYCDWLSERTGSCYRLPSEAEWEYACRAGSTAAYAFGETIDEKHANFGRNVGKTTEVGAYPANTFKLFDMHGNVWEWCADHYQGSYKGAPIDGSPLLLSDGAGRVVRGGSWYNYARSARAASRYAFDPGRRYGSLGFRCAGVQE